MRCKNCGWPNKPNATNCVKCNSPLFSESIDYEANDSLTDNPSNPLSKTVREDVVFGGGMDSEGNNRSFAHGTRIDSDLSASASASSVCPKCGYPMRPGAEKCPNCKFQVNGASTVSTSIDPARATRPIQDMPNARPTRMDSNGKPGGFRGTINPYMMNLEMEPTFVLKPLKRMEERHDFNEQEYEGKEITLNRDNTDKNNPSITSKEQAVVTNVDGRWYIEDRSSQKTTFVQAANKIELHDGDIILLGNRLFEFHK